MLELVRKPIHMNRWKQDVTTQITLDDDFIVPDSMEDMERVILDMGEIQIESAKASGEKMTVKGKLDFRVLFQTPEGGLQTLAGNIPFEEMINIPDLAERDDTALSWELEDMHSGIINSRKLSIKAMITFHVKVECLADAAVAVDVTDVSELSGDSVQETRPLEILKEQQEVAAIAVRKKDTYRIRENLQLSGTKPDIEQILWSDIHLRGALARPAAGGIQAEGELLIFVIYASGQEGSPVSWVEERIPYSGMITMEEVTEEMIPFITTRIAHKEISERPDADGEMRELELDVVLELDVKLYEEETIEILSDLYSTEKELELESGQAACERVLTKNVCKCKVLDTVELEDSGRVLQICYSEGTVHVDTQEVQEDGLKIEGSLEAQVLYLTDDDNSPIRAVSTMIPFQTVADAKGIQSNCIWQIQGSLEQLTAVMMGGDAVEIKAVVSLDLLVLQPLEIPVISAIQEKPVDFERLQQMPGIVGYIVQPGDTLWDIAKDFHTSQATIMDANGLTKAAVSPGDRLILMKEISNGL